MKVDKEQILSKLKQARDTAVNGVVSAAKWVQDNPEATVAISALGTAAYKTANKRITVTRERTQKERSVWDPSSGMWYVTRKPMTNGQKLELERRYKLGEGTKGDILASMKLL